VVKSQCIQIEVTTQPVEIKNVFQNYIGTTRYVSIKNLKLKENEEIEEIEIGSIQTCSFKSGRQCCDLLCKVLTIKTEFAAEGKIKDINLTVSDNNKRHLSSNSSSDTLPGSKRINTNNSNVVEPITGPSTQGTTSTQTTTSSQANSSIIIDSSDSDHKNISVKDMIELGRKNKFPKKLVQIGDTDKFLTPILNFFEFAHTFCQETDENISFKCKICERKYQAVIARTTNLNKHLKTHDLLDEWFKQYESYKQPKKTAIDDTNLKLIKYFISSNVALKELKNKWLRELISVELLPGPHSFRKRILPAVYEKLRQEIELRLKESSSICLLTDLWCNFQNTDFIGLCASLMYPSFEKEILVIDMMKMLGKKHSAENIKSAIESMVYNN
jgi:hypothetical protein